MCKVHAGWMIQTRNEFLRVVFSFKYLTGKKTIFGRNRIFCTQHRFILIGNMWTLIEYASKFLSFCLLWSIRNEQKTKLFLFLTTKVRFDYVALCSRPLTNLAQFQYARTFNCCAKFEGVFLRPRICLRQTSNSRRITYSCNMVTIRKRT